MLVGQLSWCLSSVDPVDSNPCLYTCPQCLVLPTPNLLKGLKDMITFASILSCGFSFAKSATTYCQHWLLNIWWNFLYYVFFPVLFFIVSFCPFFFLIPLLSAQWFQKPSDHQVMNLLCLIAQWEIAPLRGYGRYFR